MTQPYTAGIPPAAVLGRRGEDAAADFLLAAGMPLLARNWRRRRGEIDIIARDGDTIVFVEVKTRTGDRHGSPGEAITAAKLALLQTLACPYLLEHDDCERAMRIDLVGVLITQAGRHINHIKAISC
jgi:putative endonuclease